jgi:DNA-binding MarR family transcriptional regulator
MTINVLADEMVMDRTTLGRNILPLEREGLLRVARSRADRRTKELRLTDAGTAAGRLLRRLEDGAGAVCGRRWRRAPRASSALLREVSATDLPTEAAATG